MHLRSGTVCQFLKGTQEGVRCSVVNGFIRQMDYADIRICMSRHHEACAYYAYSLRDTAFAAAGRQDPADPDDPVGEVISRGVPDERQ